jgi:hypothetical protein
MSERYTLPARRAARTFEMGFGNHQATYVVTLGYSEPRKGPVYEVFISGAKIGTEMDAITRDGAILLSLALQHGVPLDTIAHAITRNERGEADSIIGAVVDRIVDHEKA